MKFRCWKCKKITEWEDGFMTQKNFYTYCGDDGTRQEMFCEQCYPFKERKK